MVLEETSNRYDSVALINAPVSDSWEKEGDRADHYQPLGLLSVASHLRENGFEGEIKIGDQSTMTRAQVRAAMDGADLVGIAANVLSYPSGLELAREAKDNGADVVLGGTWHTLLAKNIMDRQNDVDYIIRGDGEQGLLELVSGKAFGAVQNLTYRNSEGRIVMNPMGFNTSPTLTEIDYGLVPLDPYFANYQESFNPGAFKKPITMVTQKGCLWRNKSGGCKYCSRIDPTSSVDDPITFLSRLKKLEEEYGMDCFIEMSDDFLAHKGWLQEVRDLSPHYLKGKDIALRFAMARAGNVTRETADIAKSIFNAQEFLLGLESGDDEMLKRCNKGGTRAQYLRAAKLLSDRDINVYGSFILGMAGETEESLGNTISLTKELLDLENMKGVSLAPLVPFPGSEFFQDLIQDPEMHEKYGSSDELGIQQMSEDWVQRHCEVSFERLLEAKSEIEKMVEAKGGTFRKHKINKPKEVAA